MKGRRFLLWRWCANPEHLKVSRPRPSGRSWIPLFASALLLSLLAVQGIQMWAPSAISAALPNAYSTFPAVMPASEAPAEAGSSSQLTSTISTEHLTVQLLFPESADPGQAITISTTTTAKSSGKVVSLTIDVYSYVDKQLVKVASETVVKDKKVRSGDAWQTTLSVVVPGSTQRGVMIGTIEEIWEETTTYYSGPYYYEPYYYCQWPYCTTNPPYPDNYPYYYYYAYEPSYITVQKSTEQTIPLTYVVATTPEYEQLLKADEELRKNYDDLVAKHNELSSQYEALRSDYEQSLSKYNRLQSDYNSTTQELSNYQLATYVLIVVAAVLAIALAFSVLQRRRTAQETERAT